MATTSSKKLGTVTMVRVASPVVPFIPTTAQHKGDFMLHLGFEGGTYISCPMTRTGTKGEARKLEREALALCPQEPSYSESGNLWRRLDVQPDADGAGATLKAGTVVVGWVKVDPTAQIIGTDKHDPDYTGDEDDDGDENDDEGDDVN